MPFCLGARRFPFAPSSSYSHIRMASKGSNWKLTWLESIAKSLAAATRFRAAVNPPTTFCADSHTPFPPPNKNRELSVLGLLRQQFVKALGHWVQAWWSSKFWFSCNKLMLQLLSS